uniref:At1g61320/AtMIF1 LRR domain-containing protein n=1 Tax=Aegilops tauschii subsp. strangulata TaxID=200361 RepID=A0A453L6M8_AEGTS
FEYMFRLLTIMIDINIYAMQVDAGRVRQESVLGESSHDLRQMPGHVHRNIKDVVIIGFCSAKSMVELTCHMLENAKSLEYLTLNTSSNPEILCSDSENGRCLPMSKHMRMEARKALLAVERFILGKVPYSVELEVVKPCSRCNSLEI